MIRKLDHNELYSNHIVYRTISGVFKSFSANSSKNVFEISSRVKSLAVCKVESI